MATEIAFETLLMALEATRGTAEAAPTHLLSLPGVMTPSRSLFRPTERRGTLAKNYRSIVTRKGSEWNLNGTVDTGQLPFLFNMALKAVTSPTTPGGATNARLWTFSRSLTADDIKTATIWWGDPNTQVFQSDFNVIEELTIKNDAGDEALATIDVKGAGGSPTAVSDPTVPTAVNSATGLFPGQLMQLWLDTSTIGSTEITGRLLSVEHTFRTGVTYKYRAAGTSSTLDFSEIGREAHSATTKLVFELADLTQYNNWANAQTMKCRVRHNGGLIESTFYHHLEVDIYGKFDMFDWGEYQNSNRTIEMTIESEYDATAAVDFLVKVQNTRATL